MAFFVIKITESNAQKGILAGNIWKRIFILFKVSRWKFNSQTRPSTWTCEKIYGTFFWNVPDIPIMQNPWSLVTVWMCLISNLGWIPLWWTTRNPRFPFLVQMSLPDECWTIQTMILFEDQVAYHTNHLRWSNPTCFWSYSI